MSATCSSSGTSLGYLGQADAIQLDVDLMESPGFSLDQLMELAGLSVAAAVEDAYPPGDGRSVLIISGPGNCGGDGLVAARHLVHFGYSVKVLMPKKNTKNILFANLVKQLHDLEVQILDDANPLGNLVTFFNSEADIIVDGIFGFSFQGAPRPPFKNILDALSSIERKTPIVSIDIPSGWDVEKGDINKSGLKPEVLVSLTAPKMSAMFFRGRHYVGGRFLPPKLAQKYGIQMPKYPSSKQAVEIKNDEPTVQNNEGPFSAVWITAPSSEVAKELAGKVVEAKLAACVNIIPGVQSVYSWEGKIENDQEILMMLKTRSSLIPSLSDFVKEHHPYDVPEVIAVELTGGSEDYLKWIGRNTQNKQ